MNTDRLGTDTDKILAAFNAAVANNPEVAKYKTEWPACEVSFYSFECEDCWLRKHGQCSPDFHYTSRTHNITENRTESVSLACHNYMTERWNKSGYCHRPVKTRCSKSSVPDRCSSCQYFSERYHDGYNRSVSYYYEPSMQERITNCEFWIHEFSEPKEWRKDPQYWQNAINEKRRHIELIRKAAAVPLS